MGVHISIQAPDVGKECNWLSEHTGGYQHCLEFGHMVRYYFCKKFWDVIDIQHRIHFRYTWFDVYISKWVPE